MCASDALRKGLFAANPLPPPSEHPSGRAASAPAPAELDARDVWTPTLTYPTKGTVWELGRTYTVRW